MEGGQKWGWRRESAFTRRKYFEKKGYSHRTYYYLKKKWGVILEGLSLVVMALFVGLVHKEREKKTRITINAPNSLLAFTIKLYLYINNFKQFLIKVQNILYFLFNLRNV